MHCNDAGVGQYEINLIREKNYFLTVNITQESYLGSFMYTEIITDYFLNFFLIKNPKH